MSGVSQGDLVKVGRYTGIFLVVSKNAYIRATGKLHISPVLPLEEEGPLHIAVHGVNGNRGVVVCEQIKMIDPSKRGVQRIDRIPYGEIMNISDAIQGVFEYA